MDPSVTIGGHTYKLAGASPHSKTKLVEAGVAETADWGVGAELGLLYMRWTRASATEARMTSYDLVAAEVGGLHYGSPADASVENLPQRFELERTYPNPFTSTLTLRLAQPRAEPVQIELFDIRGRLILTAEIEEPQPGTWTWVLDGRVLAQGVYVLRATTASGSTFTNRITRAG